MNLEKCTSCRRKKPGKEMILMWRGGTKKKQRVYMCRFCFLKDLKVIVSNAGRKDLKKIKEIIDLVPIKKG